MKFETKSVHRGVSKDSAYNSVITPIYPSSTFRFNKLGDNNGYDYSRSGNPTRTALAENIASLEGGVAASCTSTGMSAVTAALQLVKAGEHIIAGNDIYGGTYRLLGIVQRNYNIIVDFIDMGDLQAVEQAVRKKTALIWIETPSNPLLNIVDIEAVCKIAQANNIRTVVDNTFLSPYFQNPLELGADIVLHSTTKYINGHSDVVGGALVSKEQEIADELAYYVNALGVSEAPFDSWMVLRGIKTLALRMRQHEKNALAVSQFLNGHKKVNHVYFPGLPEHPHHQLAQKQQKGMGGMLSFDLVEGHDLDLFFSKLKLYSLAESLGGVESLIEAPWFMSHASMDEEARKEAGIKPSNVRVSLGIENSDDLIEDLEQALAAI